jgi:hypothetical protein
MKARNNAITATNLRAAADLLGAHPELVQPYVTTSTNGSVNLSWYLTIDHDMSAQKDEAAAIVRAIDGPWDKSGDVENFRFSQRRGPLNIVVQVARPAVCDRIVTGTKTVTIPAKPAEPERTVEVEDVEWECKPLLADSEVAS